MIASSSRQGIQIIKLTGEVMHNIPLARSPAWSPTGDAIAFEMIPAGVQYQGVETPSVIGTFELASRKLSLLTGGASDIAYDEGPPNLHYEKDHYFRDCNPIWVPSGKWILFTNSVRNCYGFPWKVAPKEDSKPIQLAFAGSGSGNTEPIPPYGYYKGLWSSDSRWFVYADWYNDPVMIRAIEVNAELEVLRTFILGPGQDYLEWLVPDKTIFALDKTGAEPKPVVLNLPAN
ncbi:hypothetical protein HYR69_10385 [Candidatus Sumerlaeota bacterium]|nr:hypothetical protein [Candidatus Sumerlaeota bacterium]